MGERQNTVACSFDKTSPRITAYSIHEWIYDSFRLPEDDIAAIQIDGPRRRVYIKFVSAERMQVHLSSLQGTHEFKHDNGLLSTVQVCAVGLGIRHIRVTSLPPEVTDTALRNVLSKYGEVKGITTQQWSTQYRYKVQNGVRMVQLHLKTHIPSHLQVAGHRALIEYDGQIPTCYNCNETNHVYQECPHRRSSHPVPTMPRTGTWASIVQRNVISPANTSPADLTQDVDMEDTTNPTPVPQNTEGTATVNKGSDTTNNQDTEGTDTISTPIGKDDDYMLPNSAQNAVSQVVGTNMDNGDDFEQQYAKETARATELHDSVLDQPQETQIMHSSRSAEDLSPQTSQLSPRPTSTSPKRPKKMKTEKDGNMHRDRTRSRSKHK
jgi:hypothetical protein